MWLGIGRCCWWAIQTLRSDYQKEHPHILWDCQWWQELQWKSGHKRMRTGTGWHSQIPGALQEERFLYGGGNIYVFGVVLVICLFLPHNIRLACKWISLRWDISQEIGGQGKRQVALFFPLLTPLFQHTSSSSQVLLKVKLHLILSLGSVKCSFPLGLGMVMPFHFC